MVLGIKNDDFDSSNIEEKRLSTSYMGSLPRILV